MQYAVIETSGKQYKVKEGDVIEIDKIDREINKPFAFEEVLMVVDDGKLDLGKPVLSGAKVTAKLIEQKKGDKIRVMKYKAKVRYRKTIGFRPMLSVVQIDKINFSSVKSAPKSSKK